MMDSGASGHYYEDAIIRDLKYRLQDYVHLATPRKIRTSGGALLDGTAEGVLHGLVTDDYGNDEIIVRVDIVVVPRDWAQPIIGEDRSQKGHCGHLRLRKSQAGEIQRHHAVTERER